MISPTTAHHLRTLALVVLALGLGYSATLIGLRVQALELTVARVSACTEQLQVMMEPGRGKK